MISRKRLSTVLAAFVLAGVLQPATALAGGETLKRSIGNLTQFPFDIALAPVVAGKTIYHNLTTIEDTKAVSYAYAVPGFIWLTGVQAGAGVLRGIAGAFEFLPGLGLLFTDTEMAPLYDPVEKGQALFETDTGPYAIKIGVDYTSPEG